MSYLCLTAPLILLAVPVRIIRTKISKLFNQYKSQHTSLKTIKILRINAWCRVIFFRRLTYHKQPVNKKQNVEMDCPASNGGHPSWLPLWAALSILNVGLRSTFLSTSIFHSITRFRRQFLRKMWPIQPDFLCFIALRCSCLSLIYVI